MSQAGSRPDPGFVGRADEVAQLTEALRGARDGGAPLCLVLGEAGIGKSRLAARVAGEARELGFDVVWTEAEESAGPFSALAGLRIPGGDRPGDDPRWEQLDAAAAAIAARAPVLVIVEDVHWADDSSVWVVERLARHLQGVAAPILATARTDEPGRERIGRLVSAADHVVRLAGMSLDETTRLVELAAPGGAVDGSELWERTGGVPLFVREAAVLVAQGGGSQVAAGLLGRRIERLGPQTARVLAALAIAPPGTSLVVLARALGCGVEDVVAAVDASRAEDLVVDEPGGGLRFRHALLTEAAAEGLPAAERRTLRLALADALAVDGTTTTLAQAARQRLLALPAGDVTVAARDVLDAVVDLRANGDETAASALAGLAVDALVRYGAAPAQVAPLQIERGEALFALGDMEHAREAYVAAGSLRDVLDPTLRGRAEVGLAWFRHPFFPDPAIVRRLRAADAALGEGDSPLRVRLLGRIAVTSVAVPEQRQAGRSAAEEAVAMARRIGDPAVLVQALADLHLAPSTPAEWDARGEVADEIIELGERLGRPEVALLGYEWRYGECLAHGDTAGAAAAIDRLELYSYLTPAPQWRFSAGLRRATLISLAGDRDGALRALEAAFEPARPWLQQGELTGLEMGFRTAVAFLHERPDPRIAPLMDTHEEVCAELPSPFLHTTMCLSAWLLGREDRARVHLRAAAAGLETIAVGIESVFALHLTGLTAALVGDVGVARAVRPLLEPYADRLTAGTGALILPIATTVGLLCDLDGDHSAAERYHREGIALAERAGSTVMADRCRGFAGVSSRPTVRAGRGTIAHHDGSWTIASPLGTATVEESRGLLQLLEVLRANGREVPALDLAAPGGAVPVQHDLGPALDGQAKRAYRARIADLREDIDEAEAMNDPDRATRARWELDALLDELGRAVGLGGRDRPQGATDERARVNVTRSIKRAIAAVTAKAPELGSHLEVSVRTGRLCRYQPDPAVALTWEVATP